ncbi:MAG TPA: cytochrome c-type biogenesis protein CcmH [Baekduia sp.]
MRRATVLLAALALTLAALVTTGQAAQPKTSLNAIESDVMCVSCGVPLAIADSPQADAERREIVRLIRQGKTKAQIEDALVATYGHRVLASPKDSGFGLAAYLVPIVLVLLALLAGAIVLPKWKNRERAESLVPNGPPRLSDADSERLDRDLANYKL